MLMRLALLTGSNLRAAASHPASTLTLVLGAAVVAGVTTSMASLARGLYQQFADAGSPNRALVLQKNAVVIEGGLLTPEQVEFVHQVAGAMQAAGTDRIAYSSARLVGKNAGPPELVRVRGIHAGRCPACVRTSALQAGRCSAGRAAATRRWPA